jgi:hypothetical protein
MEPTTVRYICLAGQLSVLGHAYRVLTPLPLLYA